MSFSLYAQVKIGSIVAEYGGEYGKSKCKRSSTVERDFKREVIVLILGQTFWLYPIACAPSNSPLRLSATTLIVNSFASGI